MPGFVEVAAIHELKEGQLKKVKTGGREIVLARLGNRFFCAENSCPHLGGDLSEGILKGTVITCPVHHSQFDLTDGHAIRWTDLNGIRLVLAKNVRPPRPLTMHPVKVEGDKIFVAL